ncbi:MAG: cytochrome-c peroxidase [Phycisphaerales bacterium]
MTGQRIAGLVTLGIMLGLGVVAYRVLDRADHADAPRSAPAAGELPRALAVHAVPRAAVPPDPPNRLADQAEAQRYGERLFFDESFSASGTVSCATCHDPARAFTDGERTARGEGAGARNTPTILGAARRRWFTWDGRADTIWSQAAEPIEQPGEHGFDRTRFATRVRDDPGLRRLHEAACGPLPAALGAVPAGRLLGRPWRGSRRTHRCRRRGVGSRVSSARRSMRSSATA